MNISPPQSVVTKKFGTLYLTLQQVPLRTREGPVVQSGDVNSPEALRIEVHGLPEGTWAALVGVGVGWRPEYSLAGSQKRSVQGSFATPPEALAGLADHLRTTI